MLDTSISSGLKSKLLYWFKTISITGLAQIIIQGVGFATGILIIRLLPTQEYALYTLANTMLGTMTVLSDGGISAGVMSQGGKVWQDKEKLGAVLATGLDMRRKFAIFSLIVSIPILLYLLLHNGATWLKAILITLSLIPAFYAALSDSLLEIVPKLHQDIVPLQRNQVTVGIGRLIISSISLFIFPWTAVALVANGFTRIYGNFKLTKIGYKFCDKTFQSDKKVKNEITRLVKRMLPESVYYCLSGQLNIWIISIMGSTINLAYIGALTRYNMIFNFIFSIFSLTIIPRFSKLGNNKKNLFKSLLTVLALLFVLSSIIMIICYSFSNILLKILGNEYSSLKYTFLLVIISGSISLIQSIIYNINVSRQWAINPILYITISIIITFLSAFFTDLSTLNGVIYFNIAISLTQTIILIIYYIYKVTYDNFTYNTDLQ